MDAVQSQSSAVSAVPVVPKSTVFPTGRELLTDAWNVFTLNWKLLVLRYVGATALAFAVALVLLVVVFAIVMGGAALVGLVAGEAQTLSVASAGMIIGGSLGIVLVVALLLTIGLAPVLVMIQTLRDLPNPKPLAANFKEVLVLAFRSLPALIVWYLLIVLGFLLFVVPGIVLTVWLSLVLYVLAVEPIRGLASLRRSRELVRGFGWTVLARFLFIWVLGFLVGLVLQGTLGAFGGLLNIESSDSAGPLLMGIVGFLVMALVQIVVGLVSAIYSWNIYRKLVEIKSSQANGTDGMSVPKKVGLGLLVASPLLVMGVMLASMLTVLWSLGALGSSGISPSALQDAIEQVPGAGEDASPDAIAGFFFEEVQKENPEVNNQENFTTGFAIGQSEGGDADVIGKAVPGELVTLIDDSSFVAGYAVGFSFGCSSRGLDQAECEPHLIGRMSQIAQELRPELFE